MSENGGVKIAIIGMLGAVIGGVVTNWDKILPETRKTETPEVLQKEINARSAKADAEAALALAQATQIRRALEEQEAARRYAEEERLKREEEERLKKEIFAKAEIFASNAAPKIVNSYWIGGRDISCEVTDATYNTVSESYVIDIRIHWFGLYNSGHTYWATGKLTVDRDDSYSFVKTDTSSDLSDIETNIDILKLGILAGQSSNK
jgi:hypothetical protein